jgi:hypothetical protein
MIDFMWWRGKHRYTYSFLARWWGMFAVFSSVYITHLRRQMLDLGVGLRVLLDKIWLKPKLAWLLCFLDVWKIRNKVVFDNIMRNDPCYIIYMICTWPGAICRSQKSERSCFKEVSWWSKCRSKSSTGLGVGQHYVEELIVHSLHQECVCVWASLKTKHVGCLLV